MSNYHERKPTPLRPPSPQMIRMLRDIDEHGDATYSLCGASQHGGANGTRASLVRRKLIEYVHNVVCLTPAGKAVLDASS